MDRGSEGGSRVPPHSLAAEKAVIGACLLNEGAVFASMEVVRSSDFYRREHQKIYEAILNLNKEGEPVDVVTVIGQLEKVGALEEVGGMDYLVSLTSEVPSPSAAEHYGKIVSDKAMQRALIYASQKLVDEGLKGHKDSLELLGDAETVLNDVNQRRLRQNFREAGTVMVEVFEQIEANKSASGVTGIPTLRSLDRYLSGLQKGDMIVLAARPGMGKTSLAMNIAADAGTKGGASVAIFSLEMPAEQLVQRMLCSHAMVDQSKWRAGRLDNNDIAAISESLAFFQGSKIFIDDTAGITIPEVRAKCKRLQAEHGLDFVVIDYLQLMRSPQRIDNRAQEIAEISRSIKQLAKEMKVPVLALAQLSRQAENGEKPMLSHLRESGSIEQDADVVVFLHKKKSSDEDFEEDPMGAIEIIVAKNRHGATGEDFVGFQKQYTKFVDLVKDFPPRDEV